MSSKQRGIFDSKPGRPRRHQPPPGPPTPLTPRDPSLLSEFQQVPRDALHGVAGDFAQRICGKNERALPAVLLQLLACAGPAVGPSVFHKQAYSRLGANIFVVTVTQSGCFRASDWFAPTRCLFGAAHGVSATNFFKSKPVESIQSIGRADDAGSIEPCVLAGAFDLIWAQIARPKVAQSFRLVWDEVLGISLVGHLTASDILASRMSASMLETASRINWCRVGGDINGLPQVMPTDDWERISKIIEARAKQARTHGEIKLRPDAQRQWGAIYSSLISTHSAVARIVTSRADAHVLRLALIYALLDGADGIELPHLKAAIAIWDYCRTSAESLFACGTESLLATRLLDVLRHRPRSKTELHAVLHNHTPAHRLDTELEELIARGLVATDKSKTGGRSRTTFRIAETIKDSPLATPTL
jgi:hypothetical protein